MAARAPFLKSYFLPQLVWNAAYLMQGYFLAFLARLLILIKKVGYCNWSSAASALTFTCGRDNLKSCSCILPKFVMHVTNDQFSDKFNNGWKKSKWPTNCDFSPFTSLIWCCGCDNLKSFSCILFKFVMPVTNKQFPDKFNNGWKNFKMSNLLRFFTFYVNNLTLWVQWLEKFFMCHLQICYACYW